MILASAGLTGASDGVAGVTAGDVERAGGAIKAHALGEDDHQHADGDKNQAGDEWDDLRREVDDDALERAQENLRAHFSFVGLTEEFDASISLLGRIFGWSVPFYVKRNVTARKPRSSSVDVETRSLLRDANAFDLKLYEYARNLFEAQRRAGGVAFEA